LDIIGRLQKHNSFSSICISPKFPNLSSTQTHITPYHPTIRSLPSHNTTTKATETTTQYSSSSTILTNPPDESHRSTAVASVTTPSLPLTYSNVGTEHVSFENDEDFAWFFNDSDDCSADNNPDKVASSQLKESFPCPHHPPLRDREIQLEQKGDPGSPGSPGQGQVERQRAVCIVTGLAEGLLHGKNLLAMQVNR